MSATALAATALAAAAPTTGANAATTLAAAALTAAAPTPAAHAAAAHAAAALAATASLPPSPPCSFPAVVLPTSAVWALTHAAWNALVHALIGNTCFKCGEEGHWAGRCTAGRGWRSGGGGRSGAGGNSGGRSRSRAPPPRSSIMTVVSHVGRRPGSIPIISSNDDFYVERQLCGGHRCLRLK